MDIGSKHGYPASALSNFAPHPFMFDEIRVASMEGLLQSFKFDKIHIQEQVCSLVGLEAKFRGKHRNWQKNQTLYWLGNSYARQGEEYQELLDRAYLALFQNLKFQAALLASGDAVLTHSMGRTNPKETVLTQREFCSRLERLRLLLK